MKGIVARIRHGLKEVLRGVSTESVDLGIPGSAKGESQRIYTEYAKVHYTEAIETFLVSVYGSLLYIKNVQGRLLGLVYQRRPSQGTSLLYPDNEKKGKFGVDS